MSSRTSSPSPSESHSSDGSQRGIVSSAVERHHADGHQEESVTRSSQQARTVATEYKGTVEEHTSSSSSHSSFYTEYKTVTLADKRCTLHLRPEGNKHLWLHVEYPWWNCKLNKTAEIDLNQYISWVDGEIRWSKKGGFFSSTHFEKVHLHGTILIVRSTHEWRQGSCDSQLDLLRFLHLHAGGISVVAHEDISEYMSKVSWMKFRVVAEPDMHALFSSSVFQGSVQGIAERTVTHVTRKVEAILTTVLKETMEVVMESSREFIQAELNAMVFSAYLSKTQTKSAELEFHENYGRDTHVHRELHHWDHHHGSPMHGGHFPQGLPDHPRGYSPTNGRPRHSSDDDGHHGMPGTGFLGGFGLHSPPFSPQYEHQDQQALRLDGELQSPRAEPVSAPDHD